MSLRFTAKIGGVLTKNPDGEDGAVFKFTAQSIKVAVPLIAKTMVFIWSMGTDLITMARVPLW